MKVMSLGIETDLLNQTTITDTIPVLNPITIRGYQFDLGIVISQTPGMFNKSGMSVVLFTFGLDTAPADPSFGASSFPTTQNTHSFSAVDTSLLCRATMRVFAGVQNVANKCITMSGLSIPVDAGRRLILTYGHGGLGPVDLEVQGCLYYE